MTRYAQPTAGDVYSFIDSIAPYDQALSWDNVGLLIGSMITPVNGIITALDVTSSVIDEALEMGANLIVTHHPVIFSPMKAIGCDSIPWKLIENGIHVISAHTNLDIAVGGVNDALADAMELQSLSPFADGIPRIGELPKPIDSHLLAGKIKYKLKSPTVRYNSILGEIKTLAVCCGSDAGYLDDVKALGADAYLTGECKHHVWLQASESGIAIFEAGHFHTENVIIPVLTGKLREHFGSNILVAESRSCTDGIAAI